MYIYVCVCVTILGSIVLRLSLPFKKFWRQCDAKCRPIGDLSWAPCEACGDESLIFQPQNMEVPMQKKFRSDLGSLCTTNAGHFLRGGGDLNPGGTTFACQQGWRYGDALRPARRHCTVTQLLRRFWSSLNKEGNVALAWRSGCHGTIADKHCTSHGGVESPSFRYPPPPLSRRKWRTKMAR